MLAFRRNVGTIRGLSGRSLRFSGRRSVAGLRGLGAAVVVGTGGGQTVHGVELQNCSLLDFGAQYACSQANQAAVNASYEGNPGSYLGGDIYAGTEAAWEEYGDPSISFEEAVQRSYIADNPGLNLSLLSSAVRTATASTPATGGGGSTPPAPKGGSLTFATSRGGSGSTVYPGDLWAVTILGASPNTAVTVYGGKGGARVKNTMGSTDSAGRFTLSGTFAIGDVGAWWEQWEVGGAQPSGGVITFNLRERDDAVTPPGDLVCPVGFAVIGGACRPNTIAPPGGGGGGSTPPPGGGGDVVADVTSWLSGSMFGGIPNVVLLAAGGLGLYALSSGGGRR